MAKQPLNVGIGNPQPVELTSTSNLNPRVIAYKFTKADLSQLWSNEDATNPKILIGVQIEFKDVLLGPDGKFNSFSSNPAASLKVTKVYFDPYGNSSGNSYFSRVEQNGFVLDDATMLVFVVRVTKGIGAAAGMAPQWHSFRSYNEPPLPPGERHFERFNCYDKNQGVDFVYFSIRQLQVLCHLYEDFILSGCQYQMGHKLAQAAGKNGENFPKDCFSLKIEGLSPTGSTNRSGSGLETGTPGADLVLGHPCPPMWQMFTTVAAEALMLTSPGRAPINPILIAEMRKSWGSYMVGVRREDPVINNTPT